MVTFKRFSLPFSAMAGRNAIFAARGRRNEGMSLLNDSEGAPTIIGGALTLVVAMLTNRRVLVVEPEFLIALEIQRLLEQLRADEFVFTRSIEEATDLAPQFPGFDLAVVAMGPAGHAAVSLTRRLVEAGVAVVGTTAGLAGLVDLSAALAIPLVEKPFADEKFLTACAIALAATPSDDRSTELS